MVLHNVDSWNLAKKISESNLRSRIIKYFPSYWGCIYYIPVIWYVDLSERLSKDQNASTVVSPNPSFGYVSKGA